MSAKSHTSPGNLTRSILQRNKTTRKQPTQRRNKKKKHFAVVFIPFALLIHPFLRRRFFISTHSMTIIKWFLFYVSLSLSLSFALELELALENAVVRTVRIVSGTQRTNILSRLLLLLLLHRPASSVVFLSILSHSFRRWI